MSAPVTLDPAIDQRVRTSIARQTMLSTLGVSVLGVAADGTRKIVALMQATMMAVSTMSD